MCTSSCSTPCARGAAMLLISEDLDEIFALADRVAVLHHGRLSAARPAARLDAGRHRPGDGGVGRPNMRIEKRAAPSRALQLAAPLLAIAFTLARQLAARRLGRRAGGQGLCAAARRRLRLHLRLERDADARHAADPDRPVGRGGLPRAAVQHRRRGPALCRRAGRGGGRRAAWRRGLRAAPGAAVPGDDGRGGARRRAAAAGPGAAEEPPGRRRGGDHAAAQLHRAAVRVDDARRRR